MVDQLTYKSFDLVFDLHRPFHFDCVVGKTFFWLFFEHSNSLCNKRYVFHKRLVQMIITMKRIGYTVIS